MSALGEVVWYPGQLSAIFVSDGDFEPRLIPLIGSLIESIPYL